MSPLHEIRPLRIEDWEAVRQIYAEGISTGLATLETRAPGWEEWDLGHAPVPRLVALQGGEVAGWAALSPVSSRAVYRGVAEVSVYVRASARRQGIGLALLEALSAAAEAAGFWTLQASILAENEASLALHEKAGFRVVGRRERIGQRDGAWRDTILLERRSRVIGIE
ncbi:MAG TPA: GNAT family N-acetyltransferase [Gemmatimonadales bacterium]|nr:GNAT family N-acetyltransferase [Gemmatimonadales bacterium]